jgi:hypothetical protein
MYTHLLIHLNATSAPLVTRALAPSKQVVDVVTNLDWMGKDANDPKPPGKRKAEDMESAAETSDDKPAGREDARPPCRGWREPSKPHSDYLHACRPIQPILHASQGVVPPF